MNFNFSASAFSTVDTSSGIENLKPQVNKQSSCTLANAFNVRFTSEGGVRNREGLEKIVTIGSGAKVDSCITHHNLGFTLWKSGTGIYIGTKAQLLAGNVYTIGVTRTASEKDFFLVNNNDVYATNYTDSYLRIACATATVVIADSDTTITVSNIYQFSASGTVYINGDAITYSGVNTGNSTLTGVSGIATGGHAVGSIITQTSTISSAPKGTCIAELEESSLVGRDSTLSASLPQTDAEPELFYDFNITNGATAIRLSSNITALRSGLRVVMIGMSEGIDVATGFEPNSGALLTSSLTKVHRVPNAGCITEMDRQFSVLTSDGRILVAQNTDAGFQIIDNITNQKQNFDYPVQGYIQKNKDSDNSQNYLFYNPSTKILKAVILMKTGLTEEIICQTDISAWSIDTGKNVGCRTTLEGLELSGDNSEDSIYLDETGTTDNGLPIAWRITTGRLRLGLKGVTGDYLNLTYGGVLTGNGQFRQRIIYNGQTIEEDILAEDLVTEGQMTLTALSSLGEGLLGNEQLGGRGSEVDVFPFNIPYEVMFEAEYAQLEWEGTDEGTAFEIRYFDLSGEHENELLTNPT